MVLFPHILIGCFILLGIGEKCASQLPVLKTKDKTQKVFTGQEGTLLSSIMGNVDNYVLAT